MKLASYYLGAGLFWRERGTVPYDRLTFTGLCVGMWFIGICHDLGEKP